MKTLYWIFGVFALCIVLLFVFRGSGASINPPLELNKINVHDHVEGNASSSIIIMEYADFQCPACRSYYPVVKQLVQEYGGKVAFVYRHFPLSGIHPNAEFAARASEAASKQGKFWEMHNLLFEKQDEWASSGDFLNLFKSYATLVGISESQFEADFNSTEVKDLVRAYKNYATSIGLQGTPTFYINGEKIENPSSIEAFRAEIEKAIKQKEPLSYKDLVKVDSPTSNSLVKNPATITGSARGNWYFEASFPIQILDEDGSVLGEAPAQAQGDWMTSSFVPFSATINFKSPQGATGKIVFKKDNPSGDPSKDESFFLPIKFK